MTPDEYKEACTTLQAKLRNLRAYGASVCHTKSEMKKRVHCALATLHYGRLHLEEVIKNKSYRSADEFESTKFNLLESVAYQLELAMILDMDGLRESYPDIGEIMNSEPILTERITGVLNCINFCLQRNKEMEEEIIAMKAHAQEREQRALQMLEEREALLASSHYQTAEETADFETVDYETADCETADETADYETADCETADETADESVDETTDESVDETTDESVDETTDETADFETADFETADCETADYETADCETVNGQTMDYPQVNQSSHYYPAGTCQSMYACHGLDMTANYSMPEFDFERYIDLPKSR